MIWQEFYLTHCQMDNEGHKEKQTEIFCLFVCFKIKTRQIIEEKKNIGNC